MEFLLLGPLEVHSARERLPLGGPRRRALLANLALHAGAVVSMDSLVDDLWGGEPPATAEAVVQNGIAHLRRALGRETIETRAPGYVLHADPGAIDARRFERLVREARPLPPAERSAALRDSLALWRGPAFADLAFESFLQEEIARLDELRLTALEDLLDAEIELGRHDVVVADASALSVQHPSRERLCRLLMLALSRSGRQQDALDAYESLRRSLVELFGLEPSPETRALQLMILNQDPAIAAGPQTPRAEGMVRRPVALLVVELLLEDDIELEEAGAALAEARRALADVVARHGGTPAPASGPELLAGFGADGAHEDDVLRAARAGIELREILRGVDVPARFAVGTGRLLVEDGHPVLVGAVVGQTRAAVRDGAPNEILVTAAAARLGGEALELDADGRLLGARPGRPRPSAAPARFVGRAAQLEALRSAFDVVVATGRPKHVVVVGEAGIGKTRLVAAALESIPAVVLEAACVPYGEGITFLPLHELAERAAALDDRAPELGELASADAAFAAARRLLEHFTARGPVVAVLDDLHWAVPTFLDLVEYVVRAVEGPLLVVCATRPQLTEHRPEWAIGALDVEPLSADGSARLVEALPEVLSLAPEIVEAILAAAEGVPLFLEQLTSFAADAGAPTEPLPPTIGALLAGRIDALEVGEREVLARAAVVGRSVPRDALVALTPGSEALELDGRVATLVRRRLLRRADPAIEFVHSLVRDAAYDAIARPERSGLHETLARWLEARGATDELTGTHLERAALDARPGRRRATLLADAFERLARAGIDAQYRLDFAAVRNLIGRALDLAPESTASVAEAECTLGLALKDLGEIGEALATLERAGARAAELGVADLLQRSRIEQVWPGLAAGRMSFEEAESVLAAAEETLRSSAQPFGLARAYHIHAAVLSELGGRCDDAYRLALEAEDLYERAAATGNVDVILVSAAIDGSLPLAEVRRICDARLELSVGSPHMHAFLGLQNAYLSAVSGEFAEARRLADDARRELADLQNRFGLATSGTLVPALIELLAENHAAATELLEPGAHEARQREGKIYLGKFLAMLSQAALGTGQPESALVLAEESMRELPPTDVHGVALAHRIAGRAHALLGHPGPAKRFGRRAVAALQRTDSLIDTGECMLDHGQLLLDLGEERLARASVASGLDCLERKGAVVLAERGRRRFAQLIGDGGKVVDRPSRRSAPSKRAGKR